MYLSIDVLPKNNTFIMSLSSSTLKRFNALTLKRFNALTLYLWNRESSSHFAEAEGSIWSTSFRSSLNRIIATLLKKKPAWIVNVSVTWLFWSWDILRRDRVFNTGLSATRLDSKGYMTPYRRWRPRLRLVIKESFPQII